jgi:hypothetical protein
MASSHLRAHRGKVSSYGLEGIGQKVKTAAGIASSIKTIYDVGKALAPVIAGASALLL